jgi:hypothetical protein
LHLGDGDRCGEVHIPAFVSSQSFNSVASELVKARRTETAPYISICADAFEVDKTKPLVLGVPLLVGVIAAVFPFEVIRNSSDDSVALVVIGVPITKAELTDGLDRIEVLIGMQEDTEFLDNVVIPKGPFDIIIDDCGHKPEAQGITFNSLWKHLNPHGYYIIEDCYHSYKPGWEGVNIPMELTKFVNNIYQDHKVLSVQFYYNLCVVQKGLKDE